MSSVVAVTHEIAAKQDGAAQAAPAGFGAVSLLSLVLSMRVVRGTPVACFAACLAQLFRKYMDPDDIRKGRVPADVEECLLYRSLFTCWLDPADWIRLVESVWLNPAGWIRLSGTCWLDPSGWICLIAGCGPGRAAKYFFPWFIL